jgi:hypothetical protein
VTRPTVTMSLLADLTELFAFLSGRLAPVPGTAVPAGEDGIPLAPPPQACGLHGRKHCRTCWSKSKPPKRPPPLPEPDPSTGPPPF